MMTIPGTISCIDAPFVLKSSSVLFISFNMLSSVNLFFSRRVSPINVSLYQSVMVLNQHSFSLHITLTAS